MRRKHRILDTKDQKSNLSKIVSDSKNLISDEQSMLYDILTKCELIFNITLGTWKTKPVDIEIHSGVKTYH